MSPGPNVKPPLSQARRDHVLLTKVQRASPASTRPLGPVSSLQDVLLCVLTDTHAEPPGPGYMSHNGWVTSM